MPFAADDAGLFAAIAATFLLAGFVKGAIGLGLPTVALACLALVVPPAEAIAILIIPAFATNVVQAFAGPHARVVLRRTWPFLVPALALVPVGALVLASVDPAVPTVLLGLVVVLYALSGLAGVEVTMPARGERPIAGLLGVVNGIVTGITGTFVVPGIIYLQSLRLGRDALVQAMGILFLSLTIALALSLGGHGLVTGRDILLSAFALLPALAGMAIGQRIQGRLSDRLFRRLLFVGLLGLGVSLLLSVAA